jgi:hypothetical protein
MLNSIADDSKLASTFGTVFESFSLSRVAEGGHFKFRQLSMGAKGKRRSDTYGHVSFPECRPHTFHGGESLSHSNQSVILGFIAIGRRAGNSLLNFILLPFNQILKSKEYMYRTKGYRWQCTNSTLDPIAFDFNAGGTETLHKLSAGWSSESFSAPELLVPMSSTYPAIDALLLPGTLFQVGIAHGCRCACSCARGAWPPMSFRCMMYSKIYEYLLSIR